MEGVVNGVLILLALYLMIGMVFSVIFLSKWIGKLDESAKGTSVIFKLIISPGVILLWPYLVYRLRTGSNES